MLPHLDGQPFYAPSLPTGPSLFLYPINSPFVPKMISLGLTGDRVKIGRQTKTISNASNGYFDAMGISRHHAEVWEEGGKIFIKDTKSSNGTFLNGVRLSAEGTESEPWELNSDDHLEFGVDIVREDNKTLVSHKVSVTVLCILTPDDYRYHLTQIPGSKQQPRVNANEADSTYGPTHSSSTLSKPSDSDENQDHQAAGIDSTSRSSNTRGSSTLRLITPPSSSSFNADSPPARSPSKLMSGFLRESQSCGEDSGGDDESSNSESSDGSRDRHLNIPSHLLRVLGIESHQLSSLGKEEAAEMANKLYAHLKIQPIQSTEYASVLKTLQDLCFLSGKLPPSYELKDVTFDRRDIIGRGGEALVYRGHRNGQTVVIREIILLPREWRGPLGRKVIQLVHREAIIHSQLEHRNIVPFLGIFHETSTSPPITILPFFKKGSLSDLILDGPIDASEFALIVIGIARGVAYLHSRNPPIVHGDLHPGNVLLDDSGNACLCDFGLSRIRHEVTRTKTILREGGRARFLAPELSSGITDKFRTTQAGDVFALAMTFLNTWTRLPPFFETRNSRKVASKYRSGRRPKRPVAPTDLASEVEEQFWTLLGQMWAHEPLLRPSSGSVQETLEHMFPDRL